MRRRLLIAPAALALVAGMACAGTPATATGAAPAATAKTAQPATLGISPFVMHYQVYRNGLGIATATFTLERDGDGWHFYSHAQPSGLAAIFIHSTWSESSRFILHDHRLRPLVYSYTDSGSPDHNETITFDWGAGKAQDTKGKRKKTLAIKPGMLDRLSAQLEISRKLGAGATLADPFLVVSGGEVNAYRLTVGKREKTGTPAGQFDTVVVTRSDPDSGRTTIFWMAPRYHWLPVKMEQREPGEATYSFVLDHLQWKNGAGRRKPPPGPGPSWQLSAASAASAQNPAPRNPVIR